MNPFDLRGPEFLAFYVMFGVLVTMVVARLRRRSEPVVEVTIPLTDYLKIAYLRGGANEALRVATLALMDRGLVEVVDGHHLKATRARMPAGLQRTEQRLLECCKDPTRASKIIEDESLKVTIETECESPLVRAGLLPDGNVKATRVLLMIGGSIVLGLVAFVKIFIALGRGRTNISLLIVAALVFGYVLYRVASPFKTMAGEAMLRDLRQLFSALKDRTASRLGSSSGTNEIALLAAVFGMGSLRAEHEYVAETLFRKPRRDTSSCGSGGSCGSSCGGGGGGGCGGGCGGCGGG